MSTKIWNSVILIVIILVGIAYLNTSLSLGTGSATQIGSGYFPVLLSGLLFLLCAVSLVQTWLRKNPEKIRIPNLKLIVLSLAVVCLFFLGWFTFGFFHLHLAVFLFVLISIFNFDGWKWKVLLTNALIAVVTTALVYVIFTVFLKFRL